MGVTCSSGGMAERRRPVKEGWGASINVEEGREVMGRVMELTEGGETDMDLNETSSDDWQLTGEAGAEAQE